MRVGADGPAGFGLPPVVDDRDAEVVFGPVQGVRIEPFAGQKEGFEVGQVVIFHQFRFGIFAFDGPEGRGGGKHGFDLVLGDHPPEYAGIRRAHRFAFEQNGGAAFEQGAVDNVGVPHNPADIRGRPVNIAGIHVVDVFHGPFQGHHVTAVVPHNPFGFSGGSGGIKNVKRVGGRHRHAVMGLGRWP